MSRSTVDKIGRWTNRTLSAILNLAAGVHLFSAFWDLYKSYDPLNKLINVAGW